MNRDGNTFSFKAHTKKVDFGYAFIKKIYYIGIWLNDRYNMNCTDVYYEHSIIDDDAENEKITITLTLE